MPPKETKTKKPGRSNVTTACTACRLSLKKVIEVCTERIQQLEGFIVDMGASVPPSSSQQNSELLDDIMARVNQNQGETNTEREPDDPTISSPLVVDNTTAELDHDTAPNLIPTQHLPSTYLNSDSWENVGEFSPAWPASASQIGMSNDMDFEMPFIENIDFMGTNLIDGPWDESHLYTFTLPNATQPDLPVPQVSFDANLQTASSSENLHDDDDDEEALTEEESESEIIEQLSIRLGDLYVAGDGFLRYLGATSNMTLTQDWRSQNIHAHPKTLQQDTASIEAPELDNEAYIYLQDLYFTWQNSFLNVVDRNVYIDSMKQSEEKKESFFYNESLKYAISALGTMLDPKNNIQASKLAAQRYADYAFKLLETEYHRPKIATVQTLAILSCYEAIHLQDARGWLYAGMASRLAIDLGLHVDVSSHVIAGNMTAEIARARQVAFWGTYIIDQLWGFYLGRPLHVFIGEISIDPANNIQDAIFNNTKWEMYGIHQNRTPDYTSIKFTQYTGALCREFSSLATILYGARKASKDELMEAAAKSFVALQNWEQTLPEEIKFNSSDYQTIPEPQILLLHAQYHAFIIMLHRPFVSRHENQPYPLRGKGPIHARSMCATSAIEISKIVEIYESCYTFSIVASPWVHAIFTAALILLYATVSETDRNRHAELSNLLAVCCRALSQIGHRFDNASRALDTLLAIKRHWQGILVVGAGRKRSSSSRTQSSLVATRKKMKTSSRMSNVMDSIRDAH